MAKNILYTYQRYNGTDWDTLYPKTTAGQVIQSTSRVFLHPTNNTINGKTFGSLSGDTWTASAITLYGTDIKMSNTDNTTLQAAIKAIQDITVSGVSRDGDLVENHIVIGKSASSIQNSAYIIGDFTESEDDATIIPNAKAIDQKITSKLNAFTGTNKITTVGTITSGTWNGTTIAIANGGTGATTAVGARTNLGLGAAATRSVVDDESGITNTATGLVSGKAVYNAISKINNVTKIVCSTAANTPEGVTFTPKGSATSITGTLKASDASKLGIYLVYHAHGTNDSYDEYTVVLTGDATTGTYSWEKIGNTDVTIDLSGYVKKGTRFNAANAGTIPVINAVGDGLDGQYSVSTDANAISTANDNIPTTGYVDKHYLAKNTEISAGTKCKITYDKNGLVTKGENLAVSDIPSLASNKITTLTGYSKGTASSALATSDTLNAALAKLENKADNAQSTANTAKSKAEALETRNATKVFYNTSTANVTGMQEGDLCIVYTA